MYIYTLISHKSTKNYNLIKIKRNSIRKKEKKKISKLKCTAPFAI